MTELPPATTIADTAAPPEILPMGLDALVVRFAERFTPEANAAARALARDLVAQPLPGQTEIAPMLASLLIRFARGQTTGATLAAALGARLAAPLQAAVTVGRLWHLPAAFDPENAPQLAEVAVLAGRSPEQIVEEFCATELTVLALGFAPGQPYLGLLPAHWQMPRMEALNQRVPPGAIATAIRQVVLFANASPTGWRMIGRTAFRPFQPGTAHPFPLAPGDRLRFHAIAPAELAALIGAGDPMGGARREAAP